MQEKSHAAAPLLLCALLVATCSSRPDSVDTGGIAEADTLDPITAYSDGGGIYMNAPTRERLIAAPLKTRTMSPSCIPARLAGLFSSTW